MLFYMAPLEGITGSLFRNNFQKHFGSFDKLFTPFFGNTGFNTREYRDIDPESNKGINITPQILSNDIDHFLTIAKMMSDYGYSEVNLNIGCPSGTVVSKGRGSGFLKYPEKLDAFLEDVYNKSPLPVSVKTRIGFADVDEWPAIMNIYNKYPITELIVHPRLRNDLYKLPIHLDIFDTIYEEAKMPLVYNGDINTSEDYNMIVKRYPKIDKVMIGRGILRNPGLVEEIKYNKAPEMAKIKAYHDELVSIYRSIYTEQPSLFKMKEIWTYFKDYFPENKEAKKILKSKNFTEFLSYTDILLRSKI